MWTASRKGTLFLVIILLLCILSTLGYWRWTGQLPRSLLELLIVCRLARVRQSVCLGRS